MSETEDNIRRIILLSFLTIIFKHSLDTLGLHKMVFIGEEGGVGGGGEELEVSIIQKQIR